MMMQGANYALNAAQIENIKAQTEKTKAETTAIQPGIEKTQAETENIKIDTELKKLEQAFQESTFKNRESLINLTLSKLINITAVQKKEVIESFILVDFKMFNTQKNFYH